MERQCAGCGDLFKVNPRSRDTHAWCSRTLCQSSRKAKAREAKGPPTKQQRRRRAAYMRRYRESRPEYRAEEARRRRRRRSEAATTCAVTSGLTERAEAIYVECGSGRVRRLRVVTEAGSVLTVPLERVSALERVARRNAPAEPIGA